MLDVQTEPWGYRVGFCYPGSRIFLSTVLEASALSVHMHCRLVEWVFVLFTRSVACVHVGVPLTNII